MTAPARIRAAFYRGGTSKAVVFNAADLPADRVLRDRIFLHVLGSPDGYGRQLNGMGGGLSSLSKVVIVEPSRRPDADVDYTFVQISVKEPVADYGSTCGNMSSAVGPFAVSEGMVAPVSPETTVRIHNTNTGQIYRARFPVQDGVPLEEGDFEIPGVTGGGAKVTLDFLEPGGAATGTLLPTGNPTDTITTEAGESFEVSLVDAANATVFVRAADVGKTGHEDPSALDADIDLMARMEAIRRVGAVAMGMVSNPAETALSTPKVAMVAPPSPYAALDGRTYNENDFDISTRLISMGNFHKALTISGANCVGVAAQIPGTLLNAIAPGDGILRIGNPSGVLPVSADVDAGSTPVFARASTTYRTYRRLMEGAVLVPSILMEQQT